MKKSGLWATATAIAATVLFSAGAVVSASLTGPFKWSVVLGNTRLTAPIVLGPGGPYVASSAVAKLLDAKAVPNTANSTLTFFQKGALGPGQAGNPTGAVLLQNWPNSLVLEGVTYDDWRYISPGHPVTTADDKTFTEGLDVAVFGHGGWVLGPNTAHETEDRVYITDGKYKSLTFSLGLSALWRNGAGFGLVEVSTGSQVSSLTRVYTSPHVTKGFLTETVTVPLHGAKLVEVEVFIGPVPRGNNSVGLVLGNAAFVK